MRNSIILIGIFIERINTNQNCFDPISLNVIKNFGTSSENTEKVVFHSLLGSKEMKKSGVHSPPDFASFTLL